MEVDLSVNKELSEMIHVDMERYTLFDVIPSLVYQTGWLVVAIAYGIHEMLGPCIMAVCILACALIPYIRKNVSQITLLIIIPLLNCLVGALYMYYVGLGLGIAFTLLGIDWNHISNIRYTFSHARWCILAKCLGLALFLFEYTLILCEIIVPKYTFDDWGAKILTLAHILIVFGRQISNITVNRRDNINFLLESGNKIREASNETIAVTNRLLEEAKEKNAALVANEKKSLFLANMSHEIRTPINIILGMNSMILRDEGKPEIREYAEEIDSAGQNLLGLISDILDISKIEAGELTIANEKFESGELFNSLRNVLEERAKLNLLETEMRIDSSIPDILIGDYLHMNQIISNFIGNACKYTKSGKVSLAAKWDFGKLTVIVEDTGIGMSRESIDHIFDKFSRFDEKKNYNVEGAGLGMSIAKQLADAMGARIEIESEVGRGTKITCVFPIDYEKGATIDFGQKKTSDTNTKCFTAEGCSVLIVDDTPSNLRLLRFHLKDTKMDIGLDVKPLMALERCKNKKFDLILLDNMMPEMDGVELLEKIREDSMNKDTPAVVLTADALSTSRQYFLDRGFDEYVSKPVDLAVLNDIIIKFLPKEKVKIGYEE